MAILEPGRKRRRRPTRGQFVVATLWGVALAVGLLSVVGEIV